MRDVLYESLSLTARMTLHDRVGRSLERITATHPHDHLSELANHFVLAAPGGDIERAVRYSILAGQRASASAAHEEALRHFRNALAATELDPGSNEPLRCRILLDVGEVQMRAGLPEARETLLEAGVIAEQTGLATELARAALAYGGLFVWSRAGRDRQLIPLLRRALAAGDAVDEPLRVRLLARLSGALRGDPDMSERAASSAEAVAIARRLDDPATLVHALIARQMAIAGPDALAEMREIGAELEGLVDSTGDLEVIGDARGWSQVCWRTTLGLPATALQQIIDSTTEAIAPLRQPAKSWYLTVMQTVLALETGNFAGIDALLHESREAGRQGAAWDAEFTFRVARFALARERGELDEVLPLLTTAERDLPGYWMFQAAETFARAVTGHHDEARRGLARFAANGFGDLPRDNQWLWAMCHLGEAAIELDELPATEQLLGHLRPYSSLTATAAFEVIAGPVARVVGQLATRLHLFDEAEAAFQEALAIVVRNEWRPWEAWTRLRHARMLRARGGPGDLAEALVQEDVSRLIGTELGMPALLLECGAAAASESSIEWSIGG